MHIANWLDQIYTGKCEDLIPQLPDESIDLMITSPPYNVDLGNNKYHEKPYDLYNDNKEHKAYIEWLKSIFSELKPKMVSGGRICINIGDSQNGRVPTHSDVIQFMAHELGYIIKSTLVWDKSQIGNRAAWGSFCSPANPSFPMPFEYILIFCKDDQHKRGEATDITVSKEEFIRNSLALWRFAPERDMQKFDHPAMFPIELPYRLMQQLSYKGDVVLDIFSGAGTTCLAAAMLKRRWIGFELSEYYAEKARKRLLKYLDQNILDFGD